MKTFLGLYLGLLLTMLGCQQQDEIKNNVASESLVKVYGDGQHVVRTLTFPIEDGALAFESPLPGVGPIAGGVLKFVGDILARNTKLGKYHLTTAQLLPDLPPEIKSIKLKRFFIYLKPSVNVERYKGWYERWIEGQGNVSFDFLSKFALNISSISLDEYEKIGPDLQVMTYEDEQVDPLMEKFSAIHLVKMNHDLKDQRETLLLRYYDKERKLDIATENHGKIYLFRTMHPGRMKHYLQDHPSIEGLYKKIVILENLLIVELLKKDNAEKKFEKFIQDFASEFDNFNVSVVDVCHRDSCLDLKIPDINLVPLVQSGEGLKFDAIIHVSKVPESFKLKGFVEFEIMINSPI